jgi:hypothetical protein
VSGFNGTYRYVKITMLVANAPLARSRAAVADLTEKEAANPDLLVGVLVHFSGGDIMLLIGEDAYSAHQSFKEVSHGQYRADGCFDIEKLPAGTADMVMELLNVKEK